MVRLLLPFGHIKKHKLTPEPGSFVQILGGHRVTEQRCGGHLSPREQYTEDPRFLDFLQIRLSRGSADGVRNAREPVDDPLLVGGEAGGLDDEPDNRCVCVEGGVLELPAVDGLQIGSGLGLGLEVDCHIIQEDVALGSHDESEAELAGVHILEVEHGALKQVR